MGTEEKHTIHDQTNLMKGSRLLITFIAVGTAQLVTYIDQNSIAVALPTIGGELNSSSTIVWAGTAALIANTAFQVVFGRGSDILGRKVILISSLCLLAVGDLLCGFAQTGTQLYAFRGVAGMANAGIMALVMTIVSDITTLEERGKYQGILGACVGLGNTIGPFVAAGFTKNLTWRGTFYFIAPVALMVAGMLYFVLPPQTIPPEPVSVKLKRMDWGGIFLSSIGTILLLIPISGMGYQFDTASPMVISMLTLGSVFLAAFLVNEWKLARLPIFPLRLWKITALAAMLTQNFLIGICFYGLMYFMPIFFQSARQVSLITAATLLIPIVIPQGISSTIAGYYMSRTGRYGEVIWLGYTCWFVGTGLHLLFDRSLPLVAIAFILVLEGVGIGFVFQPTLVAAQAHSPKQDRAVVISARNFIRSMGGSAGLAIASAIFSNALIAEIPESTPTDVADEIRDSIFQMPDLSDLTDEQRDGILDAYMKAAHSVFYLWIGAMGTCLLLTVFVKDKGLKREGEGPVEHEQGRDQNARQEEVLETSASRTEDEDVGPTPERKSADRGREKGASRDPPMSV